MKNIRITFRLSPYQLARGLQIIKQLEPSYQLTSTNDLVKTIYQDYLAKLTMNKLDAVPQHLIDEILALAGQSKKQNLTLNELIDLKKQSTKQALINQLTNESSEATKSTVTDFSPPEDWKE